MIDRIIEFSARNRFLVFAVVRAPRVKAVRGFSDFGYSRGLALRSLAQPGSRISIRWGDGRRRGDGLNQPSV